MRSNSSGPTLFVLAAYTELGSWGPVCFVLLLLLYLLVVAANVALVVVICVSRELHQPMFLLLLSLFLNELWGSSALFPFLLVQLRHQMESPMVSQKEPPTVLQIETPTVSQIKPIQVVHVVPAPLCFLQIFVIYTYATVQFSNLAVMAYDRYMAICCPLQYATRMVASHVAILLLAAWMYPVVGILVLIGLNSQLRRCGNIIHKVYCDNFSIVKLACGDTTASNVCGVLYTCGTAALVLLSLLSYAAILREVWHGSVQARRKAIKTCTPHVVALLNFSCGCFFEVVQNRFDMSRVPAPLRIFLSLYFLTCPPLFNPLLYGLNVTQIRLCLCRRLQGALGGGARGR